MLARQFSHANMTSSNVRLSLLAASFGQRRSRPLSTAKQTFFQIMSGYRPKVDVIPVWQ